MKQRFSLKTLLAMVTLTAVAVFAGQHLYKLKVADEQLEYTQALYHVGRVDLATLLIAERNLFEVETNVPWLSQRKVIGRHIEHLQGVLDHAQARFEIGLWGGSEEAYNAKAEELKRLKAEIAELRISIGR
jgi:hypothetical protein